MVTIERCDRSSAVLTPSKLPCLGRTPTVNITEGCAHGCCYCYARGYSKYPGANRVRLFVNTAERIREELHRKRRRPRRVYFSPSSDAFQPVPEILDVTYDCMETLLEADIEVAFLTKGVVPREFLRLFARYPGKVFARVGISTLEERIRMAIEPHAARSHQRLQCIEELAGIGIPVSARLDPLVPDLTDRPDRLDLLLRALARRNVTEAAASYLFLRPAFAQPVIEALQLLAQDGYGVEGWLWSRMTPGVGGAAMLPADDRRQRFSRLVKQAGRLGITVHVCACKNPDIDFASDCRIAGGVASESAAPQLSLFDGEE